jgi:hypothetical protein
VTSDSLRYGGFCLAHPYIWSTTHRRMYTTHMPVEWRKCWVCRWCGFAWLRKSEEPPKNCASQKCRKQNWLGESGQSVAQPSTTPQAAQPAPAEIQPPIPKQAKPGKPARHLRPSLVSAAPIGVQVSPVRSGQVAIVPAGEPDVPARFAQLAATLATPHKVGERCPHGWANWLVCPTCNPARR